MRTMLEPETKGSVKAITTTDDLLGLLHQTLKFKMTPWSYIRVLWFSTVIEGVYAARVYIVGGLAGVVGVPLLRRYYGISVDQSLATELVPILVGYVTVKVLTDWRQT